MASSEMVLVKVSNQAQTSARDSNGRDVERNARHLVAPCTRAASFNEDWICETGPVNKRAWDGTDDAMRPMISSGIVS